MSARHAALAIALVVAAPRAQAAEESLARGIDPVSAKLQAGLEGFLTVEGARTEQRGSYRLAANLDSAWGLMSLKLGDEKIGDLITSRHDLHLSGAYAIRNWLELAADLPVTYYQGNGFNVLQDKTGFVTERPWAAGLGDLRALARFGILSEAKFPVSLGAVAELRLPTGAARSFMGERSVLIAPRGVVERTFFSRLRLAFEAGYRLRALPGRFINLYVGDELTLGAAAAWTIPPAIAAKLGLPESRVKKLVLYGELLTATPARAPFNGPASDALKTPLELLLGLRAQLGERLHALIGVGTGLAVRSGFGRETFRLFAGLSYERIIRDRDGDGIPDDVDKCPDDPEDFDGFQDEDGCPDPDNDGDGLPDKLDKCPNQAGPLEYDGCPDSDNDQIPDPEDKCPNEYGPASNDGCPIKDQPQVELESGNVVVKGSINFEFGKAALLKESLPVLDEVVDLLKAHPEIKRIRVDGHTDSIGSDEFNLELSRRRSQAVVDYMVSKDIGKGRMYAQGFGERKPIATNDTALGRAKNRRTEFMAMDEEDEAKPAPTPKK